jgi:hypothetical protein
VQPPSFCEGTADHREVRLRGLLAQTARDAPADISAKPSILTRLRPIQVIASRVDARLALWQARRAQLGESRMCFHPGFSRHTLATAIGALERLVGGERADLLKADYSQVC